MHSVFIDGEAGTTGLQVKDRLNNHPDIEIVSLNDEQRKNESEKKAIMQQVDVTILCLPDEAAVKSAEIAKSLDCRVLDTSSAHRTNEDWVYGMAELSKYQRDKIASAKYVTNPGCYATGSILLLKPLINAGLNLPLQIHAVSGYSGGGKQMIEKYNSQEMSEAAKAYALYGLDFKHKHIDEIVTMTGLLHRPIVSPSVVNTAQGMLVKVGIDQDDIEPFILSKITGKSKLGHAVYDLISEYYKDEQNIVVHSLNEMNNNTKPYLYIDENNGTNQVDIYITFDEEFNQTLLIATYDNLGKGASGAAIQNLNIMFGLDENIAVNL